MEVYVDYEFYKDEYKGTAIPESAFDRLALESSFYVNHCCFDRINNDILGDAEVSDKIKRATCSVAELSQKYEDKGDISSESVGNTSVTYSVKYSSTEKAKREAVKMYLADTGLMYAGVYG